MVTETEYQEYLGVTAPNNFKRLEYLSRNALRSIMVMNLPTSDDIIYNDFKKALMEQIRYFDLNSDLIDTSSSSGASLGSYNEGSSNQTDNSESISRISPVAYDILMNCGLLYSGL